MVGERPPPAHGIERRTDDRADRGRIGVGDRESQSGIEQVVERGDAPGIAAGDGDQRPHLRERIVRRDEPALAGAGHERIVRGEVEIGGAHHLESGEQRLRRSVLGRDNAAGFRGVVGHDRLHHRPVARGAGDHERLVIPHARVASVDRAASGQRRQKREQERRQNTAEDDAAAHGRSAGSAGGETGRNRHGTRRAVAGATRRRRGGLTAEEPLVPRCREEEVEPRGELLGPARTRAAEKCRRGGDRVGIEVGDGHDVGAPAPATDGRHECRVVVIDRLRGAMGRERVPQQRGGGAARCGASALNPLSFVSG